MSQDGFIQPPPGLVTPAGATETARSAPARELPVFRPATPGMPAREPGRRWRLVPPSGSVIPVDATMLIGRNPVGFGPWRDAQLVAVTDPARTVSKTHAVFERVADALRVIDAHSTNGVSITAPGGSELRLVPDQPAELLPGAIVHLGSFPLRVEHVV